MRRDCVLYLLKKGVPVNILDSTRSTPLDDAGFVGSIECAEALIARGGDPSSKNENGANVLHTACSEGHAEFVEWLLKRQDIDKDAKDKFGFTPLMWALNAPVGGEACMKVLLNHGAKVDLTDNDGNTALIWACDGNKPVHVDMLLRHDADPFLANKAGSTPLSVCRLVDSFD